MLRAYWLSASALLLVVGLATRQNALVALGVLIFVAGGIARLWSRFSLERVTYQRQFGEDRAFVGETIPLTISLTNRKFLPLPWVEVHDEFPEDLPPDGVRLSTSPKPRVGFLERATSLGWYERVVWRHTMHLPRRGYYQFGPVHLRSADLYGLLVREKTLDVRNHLVVYPRTVPLSELGLPLQRPFGEQRGTDRVFEDPMRVAGLRDYLPGDPLRRIDWKATARRRQLQSRVYEPTTTLHLTVAVNIATLAHSWEGYIPELLERVIVGAASVARHAYEARFAVGLLANGSFPESDRPIKIAAGRNPDQLHRVLEALAMIGPFTMSSLEVLLEGESHTFPLGATLVLVAARVPDDLAAVLMRIRADGRKVIIVNCSDDDWGVEIGGIPVATAGQHFKEVEAATP
jgi:uncharacterized protein (DUF58 family)